MRDSERHLDEHPSIGGRAGSPSPDRLREATCLAHSVPGVSLRLTTTAGERILVSSECLGATLDPCQLRSVLIARGDDARAARRSVRRTEVVGGLVHLGGGLFQRTADERWFATSLPQDTIAEIVERCPLDGGDRAGADASVEVTLKPDPALGICAVCVHERRRERGTSLDEIATWLLGACLVDELIAAASATPG